MLAWWSAGEAAQHSKSKNQCCELPPPVIVLADVRDEEQQVGRRSEGASAAMADSAVVVACWR